MASIHQVKSCRGAFLATALLGLASCLTTGCVTLGGLHPEGSRSGEVPLEVGTFWKNEVTFAPDVIHGGKPAPGLVGRVWLFKEKMFTMEGDGALQVAVYDKSTEQPTLLEQFNFPPEMLRKFQRKDALGAGYSLFLPLANYQPDRKSLEIRVIYQPKNGATMFANPYPLVLGHKEEISLMSHTVTPTPNGPQVAAAPPGR
jgi:hypothetical protein